MTSRSGSQPTDPFPIRPPRPTCRASPYPSNPSTHARNSPTQTGSMASSVVISGAIPSTPTTTCAARQSELTELQAALRSMKTSLGGLPPLKSAIDGLEGCVAHMQIKEQTRDKYEDMVPDLTYMTYLIQMHVAEKNPSYVPRSIANAARAIEEQTRVIWGLQHTEAAVTGLRRIKALFQQLQADVSFSTWDVSQEQQMDVRLKDLCPVFDAYHNAAISSSVTKRAGCTEGTRVELLNITQTWIHDEDAAKVYWLNGMAGTGKTTIAYSVCEMLLEKHQLGGSFFCSRNSPDCRDINRMVSTIAYQLARYSNPYRKALYDVLRNDPDAAKRNISTQFKQLISGPLTEVGRAMPTDVVVVIDALDECTDVDGTRDVLNMLLQYADHLPLKFFVSSRPEPEICEYMITRDGAMRSVIWLHDIEKSLVQADIRIYLAEALAYVQLSAPEIDQLAEHAGCLFIFAATAVRYILPAKGVVDQRRRLQAVLGLLPNQSNKSHRDIDKLYRTIVSNALDNNIYEEAELTARRQVLWAVICAREPLSILSLAELLGMPNREAAQLMIQPLQAVLHISESTSVVSTLHASFPDFMLSKERARQFHCNQIAQNSYLAECCFRLMGQSLKFNICNLESSYQFDRDVPGLQDRVNRQIPSGLFYSCQYWGEHMTRNPPTPSSLSLLESFFQQHLLFWMELLHLKEQIGHGGYVLGQVLTWLPAQDEDTRLRDFTYDARDFLTIFASNPTSLSTPHMYISVLPFTPRQSLVYKTYWPRTRGLIHIEYAGTEARRNPAIATWAIGSGVNTLALSKDGRHVVSGSENHEVSVWDISSGTRILGPLKGHEERHHSHLVAQTGELVAGPLYGHMDTIRSVAFSPDGARLASGSDDMTVRIWDAETGARIGDPLEGHQRAVMSVTFSPDGQNLASGSRDSTIRVWDWQRSAMAQKQLQSAHTHTVYSIAYSRDGHRMVSGSADRTVRVWDVLNGTLLADPFEGHTETVSSVAFSPTGTRVVSGSWDRTIRVWEAVSGALLAGPFDGHGASINATLFTVDGTRILSGSDDNTICAWDARHKTKGSTEWLGHSDIIYSVALSPDGTRAASGSSDKTICVWDTHSGSQVTGPLTSHTDYVRSVAFSPDGTQIVSGSYDYTLYKWDASTGAVLLGPVEGHTGYVRSVTFSPDGAQIASGSDDRTIRLWNSHTAAPVAAPFKGHSDTVMSIAFSPNGVRVVSGSRDVTVRMWDAKHGITLWTSDSHTSAVYCVAFSPDGTRVVSGSRDRTILVLDVGDGAVLHGPFTGHTGAILSVAFSPDRMHVVSGSYDQTVRVWDVESCMTVAGPFKGHRGAVYSTAFSPGGTRIISGSTDRTIRVWDLTAVAQPSTFNGWLIDGDGWLTNPHSQRLFWVPYDLRLSFGLLTASNPIVMNACCTTHIGHPTLLPLWEVAVPYEGSPRTAYPQGVLSELNESS